MTLIGANATVRSFFDNHSGIPARFPCGRVGKNDSGRNVAIGPSEGGPAGPQRRAGGDDVVDQDHRRARRRQGPGVRPGGAPPGSPPAPRRPARPSRAPACPAGARARRAAEDRPAPGAGTAAARGRRRGPAPPPAATEPGPATRSAGAAATWASGGDQQRTTAGPRGRAARVPCTRGRRLRNGPRYRPAATTGGPPGSTGHSGGPSCAAQPAHQPGPGASQPPQEPGRSRSSSAASRLAGDSGRSRDGGGTAGRRSMRPPCRPTETRTGEHVMADLSTVDAPDARLASRVVHRPARRCEARGWLISRGRGAPRPGRRPPPGARSPARRRRSSTRLTGRSPGRGGSGRRPPRAAAG